MTHWEIVRLVLCIISVVFSCGALLCVLASQATMRELMKELDEEYEDDLNCFQKNLKDIQKTCDEIDEILEDRKD